ncbi:MAG TPA: (2Fe-2S)-binding protein, partial [Polyangia bacterium]
VGAVLVGDLAPSAELDRCVRARAEVTAPGALLLGAAPERSAAPPVVALADDAIVCACNGVAKGTILGAVRGRGLKTRKEVAGCTGASRSCGGCGPQVDALIRMVHGDAVEEGAKKRAICECTALSREEVIFAIRERHLTSVKEVLFALGWPTEGCSSCRPAINYYLTMCWPGENVDDPRSRLVNERVHANIQRDGTYSVVPRMYGGVTTPEELIRIGEVAKRFAIPTVKLTGGQRIDLLGVKKEDLPAVWEALELPSGFAYAKAVRTVKTCVGSTWCRFGTRDAMGFGARLEKTFENLWTPAKVKMAVNACPRNCAESLIKDVGLIAGDSVWEIYVGGNGGVKVRQAEHLGSARTDEEALELIAAFLQLYREEARYGARTSEWVAELGIAALRTRLVEDAENRRALAGRMERALAGRIDPWQARIDKLRAGDDEIAREYAPLRLRLKVVA